MLDPVKDEFEQTVYFTDGTNYFVADAATGDFTRVALMAPPAQMRSIPTGAKNLKDIQHFAPKA